MRTNSSTTWPVEQLQGRSTVAAYRTGTRGTWSTERARLHETIIERQLAGKKSRGKPRLRIVMGGVGSGKSTLIQSQLAPKNPNAIVIDADRLWREIPEYDALASANWRTAGERTYAELRHIRDALLAEAAARRLDIILEVSGDDNLQQLADSLAADGYNISTDYVDCSPEVARERMMQRANSRPTPEDNLWCSPINPQLPDKYEYQNVSIDDFMREYQQRKNR